MNIDRITSLTHLAVDAAFAAGREILNVYNRPYFSESKPDGSPLTEADLASHRIIVDMLSKEGLPVLSEEGSDISFDERKEWKNYWLVDPLDGTKEFIRRNGEFTVNIALMNENLPVAGVIYQPVSGIAIAGIIGRGVFRLREGEKVQLTGHTRIDPVQPHKDEIRVVASRSHRSAETEEFINRLGKRGQISIVSAGSALKFCLLVDGSADVYPRFAPTMEWDTAAGQAILKSAGKNIYVYPSEKEMTYNKQQLINDWFIAR